MFSGVAVIALSIIVPSLWGVRLHRQVRAVRVDILALADALTRFQNEYGVWPTQRTCGYGDCRFGDGFPNRELMNALRAVDGPGNEGNSVNPQRIVFLSPPSHRGGISGLDANGEYLDPWGRPFQIVLDTDVDGISSSESTVHKPRSAGGALAWSCGPDRRSDTRDDIVP